MGKVSVKKKTVKSKFVTEKQFNLFGDTVADFAEVSNAKFTDLTIRLIRLEKLASEPVVLNDTPLTQEMINNLKNCPLQPVTVSTPPPEKPFVFCANHQVIPPGCSNCKNGTVPFFGNTTPAKPAKVSKWRNEEEKCDHLFKAVQQGLSVMQNINYTKHVTGFTIRVRCQGSYRPINVQCTKNSVILDFQKRNGQLQQTEYPNTTAAAAGIVAVVMYYATR